MTNPDSSSRSLDNGVRRSRPTRFFRRTDPDPSPANGTVDVPVTTFEYDDANRLTLETAPENRATEYIYDDLNRVIVIRLPAPTASAQRSVYEYAYDKVGNRLGELDPEGNLTRYRFDNVYRLTHVIGERPTTPSTVGRPSHRH